MSILRCNHRRGFPRRWPEFEGQRGVDVQTCVECGARRASLVQFGAAWPDRPDRQAPNRRVERFWQWIHSNL